MIDRFYMHVTLINKDKQGTSKEDENIVNDTRKFYTNCNNSIKQLEFILLY